MKGILFNTEMVQAILDNRKSCTRRVVKPQPDNKHKYYIGRVIESNYKTHIGKYGFYTDPLFSYHCGHTIYVKSPYQKGDILYVTETWKVDSINPRLNNMLIDFKALQGGFSQAEISADFNKERFDKFKKFYQKNGWQSPYFMPVEAARIFLRVTDVRVERLQDITEEQALKEGFCTREDFIKAIKEMYPDITDDSYLWVIEFERISKEEAYAERN